MFKGISEPAELMIQMVFVVLLIVFLLSLVAGRVDPLQSPELEALRLSNQISIFVNSMSTVEQGKVVINVTKPVDVNIKYIGFFDADRWDLFMNEIGQYEVDEGFEKGFTRQGHYVFVTPYRNDTQKPFESSMIFSYPRDKVEVLEKTFFRPEKLCIIKEEDKDRAEVLVCDT